MRLQKVLGGILFVAFFVLLCQGVRILFVSAGFDQFCNEGAILGISLPQYVLFLFSLIVLLFIGVQWWRENSGVFSLGWLLLFSGGVSNLFERIFFSCVTDYFRIGVFPVFNVADVFLTVGALSICFFWYKTKYRTK